MARRSTSPERELAVEANRVGVFVWTSPALRAQGKAHIRAFARGTNLANFHTAHEAREWLRLHEGRQ